MKNIRAPEPTTLTHVRDASMTQPCSPPSSAMRTPNTCREAGGIQDLHTILDVLTILKVTNATILSEEMTKDLGVGTAKELQEVLQEDTAAALALIKPLVRTRLLKHVYFKPEVEVLREDTATTIGLIQPEVAAPPPPTANPVIPPANLHNTLQARAFARSSGDCDSDAMSTRIVVSANGSQCQIRVYVGDIVRANVQGVVNAANSRLHHAGGVAAAIARANAPQIQNDSDAYVQAHGPVPVGMAVVTCGGGNLIAPWVIHTVGPSIAAGKTPNADDRLELRCAVKSALAAATNHHLKSVALPAISTGIYNFPIDEAAVLIVDECMKASGSLDEIHLCDVNPATVRSLQRALQRATGEILSSDRNKSPEQAFKAAGVVLARYAPAIRGMEVLVAIETRAEGRNVVTLLGGQRDPGENDPKATAAREFAEETSRLVSIETVRRTLDGDNVTKVWMHLGKYMCFVVPHNAAFYTSRQTDIADAYNNHRNRPSGAEANSLVWVPWKSVMALVSNYKPSARRLKTPLGEFQISKFLAKIVQHKDVMDNLNVGVDSIATASSGDEIERCKQVIVDELDNVKKLQQLSDQELLEQVLGTSAQLRLRVPPLPPPVPVQVLKPTDPTFDTVMKMLPDAHRSRVVQIRTCNVSARKVAYAGTLKSLREDGKAQVVDAYPPFFHGTPEGWRATAIAMNGFDLSIRLVGRTLGDGVYSSKDVNTAFEYCGTAGSILVMKGLVVTVGPKHANTIVRDPVFVFPDPKCVLPVCIIDFATPTGDGSPIPTDRVKDTLDVAAIKAAIEKSEKAWRGAMLERTKRTLVFYHEQMTSFKHRLKSTETTMAVATLVREISMEQRQFADKLPMYASKRDVIDTLKRHRVVVLTAKTGSGKSTQLPQILLDNVINAGGHEDDTRAVAVLEPRRVNAVSLARRVASERMSKLGDEVGYSLGRGERESSPTTRIEYMTHGLFAELASNSKALVEKYSAVVLDEAHERGVDVDLSLGMLRKALDSEREFRVVVTSATIPGPTAERFRAFLDPSGLQSTVFEMDSGPTFPVQVVHRDDLSFDAMQESVGGQGTSKVLGATATQLALDLVQQTTQGHVLIFVAGEAQVNRALAEAKAVLAQYVISPTSTSGVWGSISQRLFRLPSKGEKEESTTVGVYAFHGKLTRSERDAVLQPQGSGHHRMIIFTTNVAETGVTIPGVRYVIDTGYERRVSWNAELGLSEMVSTKASQMSLHQRRGRAGRDSSGICVRLFSKSDEEEFEVDAPPAITQTMKLKVILRLLATPMALMDEIPDGIMEQAIAQLKSLGTINEANKVTQLGHSLLRLGCSIRLGRFLIACEHFQCLESGVKIAAGLLLNSPGALLPAVKKSSTTSSNSSLVDASGDHMTIYNVVAEYETLRNSKSKSDILSWCSDHGICVEALDEACISRQFLTDRLTDCLKYVVQDGESCRSPAARTSAVLKALCAANLEQFGVLESTNNLKGGFSRFRPDTTNQKDLTLRCNSNSTLWFQPSNTPQSIVVYNSILLIEGDPSPSIEIVSFVTREHMEAGAPNWCKQVQLSELLKRNVAQTVQVQVATTALSMLRRGGVLSDLRREFPRAKLKLLLAKDTMRAVDFVEISAQPRVLAKCRAQLDAALQAIQDEIVERVELELPSGVSAGKFIGKGGVNLQSMRNSVEETLDTALGAGSYPSAKLELKKSKNVLLLELRGKPKTLLSVIVGRLQSRTFALFGKALELGAVMGDQGEQMLRVKNLRLLTTQQPPAGWTMRDDVVLQLAHAVVWKTPGYVYGGFVRDFVINGESANDVDVGIKNAGEMATVVQVLKLTVQAHRPRMVMEGPHKQRNAHLLTFTDGATQVRVDLVDHSTIQTSAPGVDTDAGNVCIKAVQNCVNLYKRIDFAGGSIVSLEDCVRHIQRKEFVLFYEPQPQSQGPMVLQRLQKYLNKGWTCLSPLPPNIVGQLNVSQGNLAPQDKYNHKWWVPSSVP
ncbi:Aste57867_1962 [Aphanomyces stellatus]|uniref:Aste57867_1962 protein n=1 Tax=Aphanomyces stellatus TaxID=120398 RepID=A0A485K711_9STRA|nr:hypothetical protein As57867_001960 [Aphanomyces stellatus]VFT79167.1 Aste57867_1962 [Aphanomyces stellatus]